MNTEEKAKAYDEALERVKPLYEWAKKDDSPMWSTYEYLFPQLAESEDERIRIGIIQTLDFACAHKLVGVESVKEMKVYLEKQKEPHFTKRNALFDKCVENCDPEIMKRVSDEVDEMLEKEQKPVEPSNDELQRHRDELYDFKVFAAKQARENHISFVHDFEWNNFCGELLSYFNEKQKPAEWSEEDTEMYINVASSLRGYACGLENEEHKRHIKKGLDWLENRFKSIRPQPHWKPNEEQMKALLGAEGISRASGYPDNAKVLASLYEELKRLRG